MGSNIPKKYYSEGSFIREITEDFEAKNPRMIYADWLEEQGDRRAEFLRIDYQFFEEKNKYKQRSSSRQNKDAIEKTTKSLRKLESDHAKLRGSLDPDWVELVRIFSMASFETLRHVLVNQTRMGMKASQITKHTRLADLKLDSLDVVELAMELEDQFEIAIPDEEISSAKQLAEKTTIDVLELIDKIKLRQ